MCSFPAESFETRVTGFALMILVYIGGVMRLFAFDLVGLIRSGVTISLSLFLWTRVIKKVSFFETEIHIKYIGSKK